jgi:hypothetical protein
VEVESAWHVRHDRTVRSLVMVTAAPLTWHTLLHTTDGVVAVATIALVIVTASLAGGTFYMARRTASLAGLTKSSLDDARAAAKQGRLPMLTIATDAPLSVIADNNGTRSTVFMRNVGSGIVIMQTPSPTTGSLQVPPDTMWGPGSSSVQLVRPGDLVQVDGSTSGQPDEKRVYIRVTYTDVLGEQRTTTFVHLALVRARDQGMGLGGRKDQPRTEWQPTGEGFIREGQLFVPHEEGWDRDWLAREVRGLI